MLRPPPVSEAPWLVYIHKRKKTQTFCTNICPISGNSNKYVKNISALAEKVILASSYGWLLLLDANDDRKLSLWNPVTNFSIFLPPIVAREWDDEAINACALTSSPSGGGSGSGRGRSSGDCVIIIFGEQWAFSFRLRGSGSSWRVQRLEFDGMVTRILKTVTSNGVIYAWAETDDASLGLIYSLVTVEVGDDASNTLSFKSFGLRRPHCDFPYRCESDNFVECCGSIYLIITFIRHIMENQQINAVKIWILDFQEMKWIEVTSLGDRAFFVDNTNGNTCCCARKYYAHKEAECGEANIERNCVYIVTRGGSVYLHRLGEHSLQLLSPIPNSKLYDRAVWVMPHHKSGDRLSARKLCTANTTISKRNLLQQETSILNRNPPEKQMKGAQQNFLSLLPPDVLRLISNYLHLFDLLNFRVTCKTVRSELPPTLWGGKINSSQQPLFILSENIESGLYKVMDPCRYDSCSFNITKLSRQHHDVSIDFSKNGWLIVYTGDETFDYLNPFTRITGQYPPFVNARNIKSIGFSTCPTSPDCVTLGIISWTTQISLAYLVSGKGSWYVEEIPHGQIVFSPATCSPVYHNGAFYLLDTRGNIGRFELVQGIVSWQVFDRPKMEDKSFYMISLVECGGDLLGVFIGDLGKFVQVFRFNSSKGNWHRVESLGNQTVFISRTSSFSVPADENGMTNRIYLPRLVGDKIIFYSLDTCQYHVSHTEETMEDLVGSKEPLTSSWI